jgi:D-arginine dehydrogenase
MMVCPQDETPTEAMDAFALELDIAQTIEQYQKVTHHEVDRVLRSWAGLRTFADDRKPVVGYASESQNFFWLAGQGGFGVQTAPGLGLLASKLILDREQPNQAIDSNRFSGA